MRIATAALLGILGSGGAVAQSALPDRGDALVAASRAFELYSDPVFNLHDFLVWSARSSNQPVESAADCLTRLPAEQRVALERAREHYKVFATPAGNRLLLALRYRLAGFGDLGLADAAEAETALALLAAAAPAYEICWWPAHDARNRRWIEALEPMLAAHEQVLSARLGELYGEALESPLPVDIVGYATFEGADSVIDPDHLLVSSVAPANAGYAALELVFHEASHTVFGPRTGGGLWAALDAAATADGAPLPRDFWHALLFYTTGNAVKARLAQSEIDYEPYVYAQNLFERAWPGFREPLERLWQPYIDGRASMTEAAGALVEGLPTEPQ